MHNQIKDHFEDFVYQVKDGETYDITWLRETLKNSSFAVVRGLISTEEVKTALQALKSNFNPADDHATVGEHPDSVRSIFQKLNVGGTKNEGQGGPGFARCLRTFYNAMWTEDIYQMHGIFRKMIKLRNLLMGKHETFAMDAPEGGVWSASRIHQYPIGGGFMGAHQDAILSGIADEVGYDYFQLLVVMSEKGKDFEMGGSFIEENGERLYFEEHCQLGDIVIYNGATLHGVADVDPHKVLNLSSINGRIAGFVSLYKDLSK